jgi:protein gp37
MTTEITTTEQRMGGGLTAAQQARLDGWEQTIAQGLASFILVGRTLAAIRDDPEKLYKRRYGYPTFDAYCRERWQMVRRHADRQIQAAGAVDALRPIGLRLPVAEAQVRALLSLPDTAARQDAWERSVMEAEGAQPTAEAVASAVRDITAEAVARGAPLTSRGGLAAYLPADEDPRSYTVEDWPHLPQEERHRLIAEGRARPSTFNHTNHNVSWAKWTWNPVHGCRFGCTYCYADDESPLRYEEGFEPVFCPGRLGAPRTMKVPAAAAADPGERNCFVVSMGDLFGHWVPSEWIDAVLAETAAARDWNFLYLTKNPNRLTGRTWPANAWVGTSVDTQARVSTAVRAFRDIRAAKKWLSCEPLLERLTFRDLSVFGWVVIGAQSKTRKVPEFQPPWEWVEHLMNQARAAGVPVYVKPNLTSRPREYPAGWNRDGEVQHG